jgi:cytidylate kinase
MNEITSVYVVAVDGKTGTGKSTACGLVASLLGFGMLRSGKLYRAVYLMAKLLGISDEEGYIRIAQDLPIVFDGERILLDGVDYAVRIESDECGVMAPTVARIQGVRDGLRALQLSMRKPPGLVAEGRDMGDIFEGSYRVFLTIEPEVAARRRVLQFEGMGLPADYDTILSDIKRRDQADMTRDIAPLRAHPEAKIIDTSYMTPREVADQIVGEFELFRSRRSS